MPKNNSVIPVNPKTGKPIKSPKRGQSVLYRLIGPRGGKGALLSKTPQTFYKTDYQGLKKVVEASKGGNFKVHEQLTRRNLRIGGKVQYHEKGKLEGKPKKEIKITVAKPVRKQRPVLFIRGRKRRELQMPFTTGNYKDLRAIRQMQILKVQKRGQYVRPYELVAKGKTLKAALKKIQADIGFSEFAAMGSKAGMKNMYYNVLMKITDPMGNVQYIPVNSRYVPSYDNKIDGFGNTAVMDVIPGQGSDRRAYLSQQVQNLSRLHTEMSRSIRLAMKDHGLTFTSAVTLGQIKQKAEKEIKQAKKRGATPEELQKLKDGKKALTSLNGVNPKKLIVTSGPGWKVVLYIKFELF